MPRNILNDRPFDGALWSTIILPESALKPSLVTLNLYSPSAAPVNFKLSFFICPAAQYALRPNTKDHVCVCNGYRHRYAAFRMLTRDMNQ